MECDYCGETIPYNDYTPGNGLVFCSQKCENKFSSIYNFKKNKLLQSWDRRGSPEIRRDEMQQMTFREVWDHLRTQTQSDPGTRYNMLTLIDDGKAWATWDDEAQDIKVWPGPPPKKEN